jgi:hypothetical protein
VDVSSLSRWFRRPWGLSWGCPTSLAWKWLLGFRGPRRAWNQRASRAGILKALLLVLVLVAGFTGHPPPSTFWSCLWSGTAFVGSGFAASPPLPNELLAACPGCIGLCGIGSFSGPLQPKPNILKAGRKVLARRWGVPCPWCFCVGRLADVFLFFDCRRG